MPEKIPNEQPEQDPLMEALSRVIDETLVTSDEVRQAVLALFEERPELLKQSHMVMMLKLDALAEALGLNPEFSGMEDAAPHADMIENVGKVLLRNVVEGEEISESEKAFREYLAESFDEAAWLRKNHLIF